MREASTALAGVAVLLASAAAVEASPARKTNAAQQTATDNVPEPPAWKYGVAHAGFQFTIDPSAVVTPKNKKNKADNDSNKERIFCGVYYPPKVNNTLFFVNNTNKTLPKGTKVKWTLQGKNGHGKPHTYLGLLTPIGAPWLPNPPNQEYWASEALPTLPMQAWDTPCEAWAILP